MSEKVEKLIDPDEVLEYLINCPTNSKLYLGSDSSRFRVNNEWWREITSVLVVHLAGRNGCKIFGQIVKERDYEKDKSRPIMRMMSEVYAVTDLFKRLEDVIIASNMEFEIHIDINSNRMHGSAVALDQAIGYIKGMTGIEPKVKPDSPCASFSADRWKEIRNLPYSKEFKEKAA